MYRICFMYAYIHIMINCRPLISVCLQWVCRSAGSILCMGQNCWQVSLPWSSTVGRRKLLLSKCCYWTACCMSKWQGEGFEYWRARSVQRRYDLWLASSTKGRRNYQHYAGEGLQWEPATYNAGNNQCTIYSRDASHGCVGGWVKITCYGFCYCLRYNVTICSRSHFCSTSRLCDRLLLR